MKNSAHLYYCLIGATLLATASCIKQPAVVQPPTVPFCTYLNPVYTSYYGSDSAMLWIPNCFAPGDSSSPNDSLVEFEKNMAQLIVTLSDSADSTVYVYNNHSFQYPGFDTVKLWNGYYQGVLAPQITYLIKVNGTTLFGTSFSYIGHVSLIKYFSYKGISGGLTNFPVKCASCYFNTQWGGSNVNPPASPDTLLTNNNYIKCE